MRLSGPSVACLQVVLHIYTAAKQTLNIYQLGEMGVVLEPLLQKFQGMCMDRLAADHMPSK